MIHTHSCGRVGVDIYLFPTDQQRNERQHYINHLTVFQDVYVLPGISRLDKDRTPKTFSMSPVPLKM